MVDTCKLELTVVQVEILRLLCQKVGEQLNQRQIASHLQISPPAVAKSLPLLVKNGLVRAQKSQTMNLILIDLNVQNLDALQFKRTENLRLLYETGFANKIAEKFPGSTAIVVDDFAKGTDTTNSTIEIIILQKDNHSSSETEFKKYESQFNRPIKFTFFKEKQNILPLDIKKKIYNGIVLVGEVDL